MADCSAIYKAINLIALSQTNATSPSERMKTQRNTASDAQLKLKL